MKRVLLLVLFLLYSKTQLLAQNQKELDSLQLLLPKVKDTTEVNVLYSIARFEFDRDGDKALHLSKESLHKAKKLKYLHGEVMAYKQIGVFYNLHKNDFVTSKLYLDSAEVLAVTDPEKGTVYSALGALFSRKGEFEKSHVYLMRALDVIHDKNSRQAFNAYSYVALNLSLLNRHREAIQYYKKCLVIADQSRNERDIGLALSNLGISYMNMEEFDSALRVYRRLYKFELAHGNPLLNPTLLSELGKLYFEKNKPDSAYYFMHTGLHAAYHLHIPYAISRSLSNLGRYHLKNHPDSALFYGRKLYGQINRSSKESMEDASYILSKAFGKLKRYDSAFYYSDQYTAFHDSIFQEKMTKQIAELETRFELKRKQEEIKRLETSHQNEVIKRNALAGGFILSILVAALVYFVLRARIQARKREIEVQKWQLENFTRTMVEKSELVEELRAKLEQFQSEITIPKERIDTVSQILQSSILTENEWEEFKLLFSSVNPTFFAELKLKHPTLTQAEVRLAALIKLNLNTREMANMLGISTESANKARYRLRKKLELPPEQELKDFIENVSTP